MRILPIKLWFYVPDYVAVKLRLEEGYVLTGVSEWSAEPGRVRNNPNDADVNVVGDPEKVEQFRSWLIQTRINGLRIEGKVVTLLTDEERREAVETAKIQCLDHMFGDGLEEEYVLSGFPSFRGLLNMTDDELLQELGHYDPNVDDTPEKRVKRWREELDE